MSSWIVFLLGLLAAPLLWYLMRIIVRIVTFTTPPVTTPPITTLPVSVKSVRSETCINSMMSDHIITDILSRVPADSILLCRTVCKSWNRLTNAAGFPERHLNRATDYIFGRVTFRSRDSTWFFVDDVGPNPFLGKVELKGMENIRTATKPRVHASCNGLLIFGNDTSSYVICNPVIREEVTFSLKPGDKICGFYFHPSEEEFKLLIYHSMDSDYDRRYNDNSLAHELREELRKSEQELRMIKHVKNDKNNRYSVYDTINAYSVYGLSTRDWKRLRNPIRRVDEVREVVGVATCGGLFWTITSKEQNNDVTINSEKIIMFNMETETFVLKPQPGDRYKRQARTQVKLLEIEGRLGCFDVYKDQVEVWILEDVESWKWGKRYVVDVGRYTSQPALVGIQNGNLLLMLMQRDDVGLLWCNLRLKFVKQVETGDTRLQTGNTDNMRYNYCNNNNNSSSIHSVQYKASLVSIKDCNILPEETTSTDTVLTLQ